VLCTFFGLFKKKTWKSYLLFGRFVCLQVCGHSMDSSTFNLVGLQSVFIICCPASYDDAQFSLWGLS
jgi:hypothetical protein